MFLKVNEPGESETTAHSELGHHPVVMFYPQRKWSEIEISEKCESVQGFPNLQSADRVPTWWTRF